jgi:hypothetical protein
MATRSTIAVIHDNGTVSQIYCHWDGYLQGVGAELIKNYSTPELAEELISLGDISSLHRSIHPKGNDHTFDCPENGVTVFYGRDRGELDTQAKHFDSVKKYLDNNSTEDYNYLYQLGQWFYSTNNLKNFALVNRCLAVELSE